MGRRVSLGQKQWPPSSGMRFHAESTTCKRSFLKAACSGLAADLLGHAAPMELEKIMEPRPSINMALLRSWIAAAQARNIRLIRLTPHARPLVSDYLRPRSVPLPPPPSRFRGRARNHKAPELHPD